MCKTIYELEIHEEMRFTAEGSNVEWWVMRVQGGWIYSSNQSTMCFVPYNR